MFVIFYNLPLCYCATKNWWQTPGCCLISGVNLQRDIYLWPSGRVDNLPLNIKTWKLHKFKIWGWWRLKVNYIFWDRLWSLQLILLRGLFQQSSHLSLGKVFNYTELPLLTHILCRPSWDTVRAHEDVQTSWFFNSGNFCLTHLNDESFNHPRWSKRSLKFEKFDEWPFEWGIWCFTEVVLPRTDSL